MYVIKFEKWSRINYHHVGSVYKKFRLKRDALTYLQGLGFIRRYDKSNKFWDSPNHAFSAYICDTRGIPEFCTPEKNAYKRLASSRGLKSITIAGLG